MLKRSHPTVWPIISPTVVEVIDLGESFLVNPSARHPQTLRLDDFGQVLAHSLCSQTSLFTVLMQHGQRRFISLQGSPGHLIVSGMDFAR